ncbi:MAG TPA: GNAT family N-acetyltransferase [Roseiflexaceae bacterium]|nr:GNAT family N-acetyltransferase [Roseiflexaceae bacterium]
MPNPCVPRSFGWKNTRIELSCLQPGDDQALAEFLGRLSAQTLYLRYFAPIREMGSDRIEREIARLRNNQDRTTLLGRLAGEPAVVLVVEVAYRRNNTRAAELAITIDDAFQRQGIGRTVFALLPDLLACRSIDTIEATALAENVAVRKLFSQLGSYQVQRNGDAVSYLAYL